jgi:hypothetical protein
MPHNWRFQRSANSLVLFSHLSSFLRGLLSPAETIVMAQYRLRVRTYKIPLA